MNNNVKKTIELLFKLRELIGAAAAIVLWLLALWFTSRIAPISRRIDLLEQKVLANENSINANMVEAKELDIKVWTELRYIRERVDNIYNLIK